ncbi:MAG: Uma2 family endonuclease [Gemmataceae bacterium]
MNPTTTSELMTADEFLAWVEAQPADGRRYELDQGRIFTVPPPNEAHAMVCWFILKLLTGYLDRLGRGTILANDGGLIVRYDPDTIRGPDIALQLMERDLADALRGPSQSVPDLVVEVRSPSDRDREILRRVRDYHELGVPLVWVVDFEVRYLTLYRPAQFPVIYEEADLLEGHGVLPDFRCSVADLFRSKGYPNSGTQ